MTTRRRFLATSAATLAAPMFVRALGTNDKLNLAGVAHENIVALCDIDGDRLGAAKAKHPGATGFADYREMFDKASSKFDAVVVSTPDHSHALPACLAMSLGKHVYCEKPLAHSVNEVRLMRTLAAKKKLVTQMGTQIHAENNYRRVVEIVQAGLLGPISRVHVWNSSKPVGGKKTGGKPTAAFDTDLWCGPAPVKFFEALMNPSPWKQAWPHFHWRWWWEFGGGTLADLGCHYIDLPFWALGLTAPTSVQSYGRKTYIGDNDVPDVMQVDYSFSRPGNQPALRLTWYHGVSGPGLDGKETYKGYGSGVMFVGTKGKLIADYGKYTILPEEFAKDFKPPEKSIPASIGHHKEWTEAVKSNGKTTCNFDYSGGLTEAVLLGNVALKAAEEIAWFPDKCKTHAAYADQFLGREYRKGWELPKG